MRPINMIDLRGTDLNLLVSLDALIEEANVTRAAARLNISQPALSAQLTRLRDLFRDPLLVPSATGRGMIPTARALQLRGPLHVALKDLETVVKRPPAFDPLTAERVFAIAASDHLIAVLGTRLIERVQKIAGPRVRVSFRTPNPDLIATQLERGQVDLLIANQRNVPSEMKSRTLYEDRHVMAQRKGHPRGTQPLDLDTYCGLSHVLVSHSGSGSFQGDIDEQLENIGRRRHVALSVHQVVVVPMFLTITDYVAALPSRLLDRFTDQLDVFDLPLEARSYTNSAAWHPRYDADPGHIWLREQLNAIVARWCNVQSAAGGPPQGQSLRRAMRPEGSTPTTCGPLGPADPAGATR
jgi:DNA-binding transcriptional LysR family regulator